MSKIHQPYPTLYTKKAGGGAAKLQQWNVYVVENSPTDVLLRMEYGEVAGKQIRKDVAIKATKLKRTPLEEAFSKAKTKYEQKINKEGYLADQGMASNTQIVLPMLANKFNPKKPMGIKFPCYGQPKLDGNRALINRTEDNKINIVSRNNTPIYFFDHLRKILVYVLKGKPPTFYLDGELFSPEITFNQINGFCNKSANSKITDEEKTLMDKMRFYIFDCFDANQLEMPTKERFTLLAKMTGLYSTGLSSPPIPTNKRVMDNIILVGTCLIQIVDDVVKAHESYIQPQKDIEGQMVDGYEGIMLRNIDAPYELKKRSKHLQKYKTFMDEEFVIVGYREEQGNGDDAGTVVWDCETNIKPAAIFGVKPKGTVEYRRKLLENAKKYLGCKLTVTFQDFTDGIHGIPRFPVGKDFRF